MTHTWKSVRAQIAATESYDRPTTRQARGTAQSWVRWLKGIKARPPAHVLPDGERGIALVWEHYGHEREYRLEIDRDGDIWLGDDKLFVEDTRWGLPDDEDWSVPDDEADAE